MTHPRQASSVSSMQERTSRVLSLFITAVVLGGVEIVLTMSLAALIFSGPLSPHLPTAIGLSLLAAAVMMLVSSLFSSVAGAVGSVQDTSAAILAVIAVSITTRLDISGDEAFYTVVAAMMVASLAMGLTFYLLGALRLGGLIRFIPYPVVGGFMAGTGWLLVWGSLSLMADTDLSTGELLTSEVLVKVLPGAVAASLLLFVLRRRRHHLILPGALVGGTVLFYAVLLATGGSVDGARQSGWLMGPFPRGESWRPLVTDALGAADWGSVISQAPGIASLVIIGAIALLLNATGIETLLDEDLNLNKELRVCGIANAVVAFIPGLPGYHALSLTALAERGGRSRASGVIAAAVCIVALLLGPNVISVLPRALLGGLLLLVGMGFLVEWLYDARDRLSTAEYGIVVVILIAVVALGFLPGVLVGLMCAVVVFVVNYSRSDVVKHSSTGAQRRSRVDRPASHMAVLRRQGENIHALELQGFLFFGTTHGLLQMIRKRIDDALPLRFFVLDFRRVTGLDSSALSSFVKCHRLARSNGFALVFTDVSDSVRTRLLRAGLSDHDSADVAYLVDLDHGLQWCEEQILLEADILSEEPRSIESALASVGAPEDALVPYLERMALPGGYLLFSEGEEAKDLYYVESGRLAAKVAAADGTEVRLRSIGPGNVVGEIGLYTSEHRNASVMSEGPCVVHRLSKADLVEMERNDPRASSALHRFMAVMLAGRLAQSTDTIRALSR
jgi:sulfate permease, SulP family